MSKCVEVYANTFNHYNAILLQFLYIPEEGVVAVVQRCDGSYAGHMEVVSVKDIIAPYGGGL